MYLCGSSSSQFQPPLPRIATIQPRRVHTRARAACVANSGSWVPSVGLRSGVHRLCWACPLDLQISPPLLLWGGPWPEVPSGEQPLGGRRETGHSFSSFCGVCLAMLFLHVSVVTSVSTFPCSHLPLSLSLHVSLSPLLSFPITVSCSLSIPSSLLFPFSPFLPLPLSFLLLSCLSLPLCLSLCPCLSLSS